jgi:uncharacterized protein (TIGR01777 family)
MKPKIIIAGGTGFLGTCLRNIYNNTDVEIIILSRKLVQNQGNVTYVQWDAKTLGNWTSHLEGSTAIINLVGKSVNCRYTEKNKKEIIASRVDATSIIGKAITTCKNPPKVWINAGSAAIFGDSGSAIKDEDSPVGSGFSPQICKEWEKAFNDAETPNTRKVFLRMGLVLQQGGGILKPFMNLARFGLGGKIGTGNQYMTWIHEEDFTNVIDWIIQEKSIQGILHCSSPNPVTNKDFMKAMRSAVSKSFGFPNPAFLIRMGAIFIGTEAELVLSGRRVVSRILEENNFEFKFPHLTDAVQQITIKKKY